MNMTSNRKLQVYVWVFFLFGNSLLNASEHLEENAIFDESTDKDPLESRAGSVLGKVIIGNEEGWRRGRVEEQQLLASAKLHNYEVKIQDTDEVPCNSQDDSNRKDILIFLPRAEGIIAAPVEELKKALLETSAEILLPSTKINALVGWSHAVRTVAKATGVTSLTSLAKELHSNPKLRHEYNIKADLSSIVFHILDDLSSIGNQNLEVVEKEDQFELLYHRRKPCIVLASPKSAHARALLLAVSDYLVGTHRPQVGCVSCLTIGNEFHLNVSHRVMVAVFITQPQPFLEETLSAVMHHGLDTDYTHFFIYNQVEDYKRRVEIFVDRLELDADAKNITVTQVSGKKMGVGNIKNMALRECLRIDCKWYVNLDSYAFTNPQVMGVLLTLGHPVIAPAYKIQNRMPASFWREIDGASSTPTYSWDHQALLDDKTSLKGYWHASCIRGVYAIRHDVLAILSDPYTHNVPNTDAHSDSDMAFCEALREEGIPMIATSAFPNSGILLNITNYKPTDHNIAQYNSNPVMWTMTYVNRDIQKVISGEFGSVKRPCHEVYEIPVFNQLFAYDILDLAKRVNRWSPGHSFDQRKEFGIEPVPTVDQWFSQLGLKDVFTALNRDIFSYLQKMGYPFSNTGLIKLGLLARFQPNEISGLPLHHDSGIMTMYINLTPLDEYKGGEVEFPKQECKVRSKLGHLLLFPSRLTHPKILHNVTEGVLYKIMMYTKEITAEDIHHNENDNH